VQNVRQKQCGDSIKLMYDSIQTCENGQIWAMKIETNQTMLNRINMSHMKVNTNQRTVIRSNKAKHKTREKQ